METKTLTKSIFIQIVSGGKAIITYPTFTFPEKCVICGNPKDAVDKVSLKKRKLISRNYIPGGTQSDYVNIEMNIEVPLCSDHKKEVDQKSARIKILLTISIILGCIIVALFSFANPQLTPGNTTERIVEIGLITLFGGCFGGLILGGIVMSLYEEIRRMLKIPPYFATRAYAVSLEDDPKNPTLKVSVKNRK